jgi:hypothetical protein
MKVSYFETGRYEAPADKVFRYARLGSLTSIPRSPRRVRFCSKSGGTADIPELRIRVKRRRPRIVSSPDAIRCYQRHRQTSSLWQRTTLSDANRVF